MSWNTGVSHGCGFVDPLASSRCVPRYQVAALLESPSSKSTSTAPVGLVVRFSTSTSVGDFGSIAAKQLLLCMTASVLTSGSTNFAVVLGQQVRVPSW